MSQSKGRLLDKLSDDQLLKIAGSALEPPITSKTSRSELVKIIKENLSLQEIEGRVRNLGNEAKTAVIGRNELRLGGVSQVFLAASVALSVIPNSFSYFSIWSLDYYTRAAPWGIASSALLFVFAALLGFCMFKVATRVSSNAVGKAASALGFVAALTNTIYYVSTLLRISLESSGYGYYTLNALGVLLVVISSIFFGSTLILLGAFLLLHHKQSNTSELWLATGIVYMLAGSLIFSFITYYSVSTVTILAGVMGATCFLMTKSLQT